MSLLKVSGLRKAFGGLRAVDGLSFEVSSGEVLGLIGPNGSGKTTAMNLISGALRPDGGSVVLKSRDIAGLPPYRIARLGIARTFQLVRVLGGMTCAENVEAGMAFRRDHLFGSAARNERLTLLARVGLAHRADVPAHDLTYVDQERLGSGRGHVNAQQQVFRHRRMRPPCCRLMGGPQGRAGPPPAAGIWLCALAPISARRAGGQR